MLEVQSNVSSVKDQTYYKINLFRNSYLKTVATPFSKKGVITDTTQIVIDTTLFTGDTTPNVPVGTSCIFTKSAKEKNTVAMM